MIREHYVPLYRAICTSERFADLKEPSRVFYVLLLTNLDAWGRVKGTARVLTAVVWPLLGKSAKDTESALADCERVGLIQRYEVDGEPYLALPDWEGKAGRVGKERRAAPQLPGPPERPPPSAGDCISIPAPTASDGTAQEYSRLARAGESEPSQAKKSQAEPEKAAASAAGSFAIPPSLDTPDFHEVWAIWVQYRREKGSKHAIKPIGASQQLAQCAALGPARAIAALRHTMAMGWIGMREPDPPSAPRSPLFGQLAPENSMRAALESESRGQPRSIDVEGRRIA